MQKAQKSTLQTMDGHGKDQGDLTSRLNNAERTKEASTVRTASSRLVAHSEAEAKKGSRRATKKEDLGHKVRISGTALACAVFLFIVASPVAYLSGVMLGREHPLQIRAGEALAGAQEKTGGKSEPKILSAAELKFGQHLHGQPNDKKATPKTIQPLTPESAQASVSPAVIQGPPQPSLAQGDVLYDYVFQIAAYRNKTTAEQQRPYLEKKGFQSRLVKSGKLTLVQLLTRGPASHVLDVRAALIGMNMGEPILVTKKVAR